jgi:uncharacterized membrane protein YvbJ
MIPYMIMIVCGIALSSPKTVVSWLPQSVSDNEKQQIQQGLENTYQGIQDTSSAIMNICLRVWMSKKR